MTAGPGARRPAPTLAAIAVTGLLSALATVLCVMPASAQELTGVALGPDGGPLTGHVVVLHQVGSGGAGSVSTDTTDGAGGFQFQLEPGAGVYFAALRYEGRMYIGPAAEGGDEPVTGYVLRVEPGAEAGAVASGLAGSMRPPPPAARPAASTAGRAGGAGAGPYVLVGLLALTAAVAFVVSAPRYRRRRTREALIELAGVENALADPARADERAALEAEATRLRERLARES